MTINELKANKNEEQEILDMFGKLGEQTAEVMTKMFKLGHDSRDVEIEDILKTLDKLKQTAQDHLDLDKLNEQRIERQARTDTAKEIFDELIKTDDILSAEFNISRKKSKELLELIIVNVKAQLLRD